jgi:hypothetical protein
MNTILGERFGESAPNAAAVSNPTVAVTKNAAREIRAKKLILSPCGAFEGEATGCDDIADLLTDARAA